MFSYQHYVPILRWKRGERIALRNVAEPDRKWITPLIEFLPKDFPPDDDRSVIKKIGEVQDSSNGTRLFVDFLNVPNVGEIFNGNGMMMNFFRQAVRKDLNVIPVTGVERSAHYQTAVAASLAGDTGELCFRIRLRDIFEKSFVQELGNLMTYLHVGAKNTHLIVDCGTLTDTCPHLEVICERLPYLDEWRTFTFSSGYFPRDLRDFEKNRQHTLERKDWLKWRNESRDLSGRRPSFSDYTVQYGSYVEPPGRARFSASIRYTSAEYWVIMRGEDVFSDDGPGFDQWPANAQLLTERSEFCGEGFSYGDKYIYEMGMHKRSNGNAETWIRAGINHHLVFAARQIASLPAS